MPRRRRTKVALGLQLAAVVAAPIALGGVHVETALALLPLALAGLAVQLWARARSGLGVRVTAIGWLLLAWALIHALQLIPLPQSLLAALSPMAATLRSEAVALAGVTPEAAPLSLSPAATAADLLRAVLVLATFIGVAGISRMRQRQAQLVLHTVVGVAVLLVLIALFQEVLKVEALLGLYEPRDTSGHRFFWSTFVNQNHFGAFLCLAAPVALGVAIDRKTTRQYAHFHFWSFLVISVAVLLTLSRSAIAVLAFQIALFAALGVVYRRRQDPSQLEERQLNPFGWGAVGLALVAVLAVGAIVSYPRMAADWGAMGGLDNLLHDSKLAMLPDAWRCALAFPLTGVGVGAYAETVSLFNTVDPTHAYHFVESGPLQLAVDMGLPAAGALILTGLTFFLLLARRAGVRPLFLGCAIGVFGVFLQNLVDFGLAFPGVALPTAAVLGALCGLTHRSTKGDRSARRAWIAFAIVPLVAAALVPAGLAALEHDLTRSRQDAAAGGEDVPATIAYWHPADPVSATATAQRFEIDGDTEGALRWLARARELFPNGYWPALHELRLALKLDRSELARDALATLLDHHWRPRTERQRFLALLRSPTTRGTLLGEALGWEPARVVEATAELHRLPAGRDAARAALERALVERPDNPELLYALGSLEVRGGDAARADTHATRLVALHPQRFESFLLQGEVFLRQRKNELAQHMFEAAHKLAPHELQPLLRRAEALLRLRNWGALETVFTDARGLVQNHRERAQLLFLRSRAADLTGDAKTSLRLVQEAERYLHDHPPFLRHRARLLEKLERHVAAQRTWEHVLELRPKDAQAREHLTRLKTRSAGH